MNNGLSIELLVQLFLVFEGYSLWKLMKLPETTKLTPADYDAACDQIWQNGDASNSQKVERALQYKKALDRFIRAKGILGILETQYIPIFALSGFLIASIFTDVNSVSWRKWTTAMLTIYFLLKIVAYSWGKRVFLAYQAEQDKLNRVVIPDAPANEFLKK